MDHSKWGHCPDEGEPGTFALWAKANPENSYQVRRKDYSISPFYYHFLCKVGLCNCPSLNFPTSSFLFAVCHCCHWCTWNQMHIHLAAHFKPDISTPFFLLLLLPCWHTHYCCMYQSHSPVHPFLYFPTPFFSPPSYYILYTNSNIFFFLLSLFQNTCSMTMSIRNTSFSLDFDCPELPALCIVQSLHGTF